MRNDPQLLIGREIRRRRLSLRLSQEKLAERADLHWTYVGGVERGERNISLRNIVRLAKALDCTPSELLRNLR